MVKKNENYLMSSVLTYSWTFQIILRSRCARCGDGITDKCITALDLKWHPEHFLCEGCGKPLAGGSYIKKGTKVYCSTCEKKQKQAGKVILAYI